MSFFSLLNENNGILWDATGLITVYEDSSFSNTTLNQLVLGNPTFIGGDVFNSFQGSVIMNDLNGSPSEIFYNSNATITINGSINLDPLSFIGTGFVGIINTTNINANTPFILDAISRGITVNII